MTTNWNEFFEKANKNFVLVAGPCSIESSLQLDSTASHIKKQGVSLLRGGVYKLRTSPKSFQGLGEDAFQFVKSVKEKYNLAFVAEMTDPRQMGDFEDLVDMVQVGSRNMYNYSLLKDLGAYNKPVLLKRGFSATLDEWMQAADYVVNGGNSKVILCERGIRGFDNKTRNVLDLASVSYLKKFSDHLVYVDPSHATGMRELVTDMALAAVMSGADGLMVEVHPNPKEALSDGPQALNFEDYSNLVKKIEEILPFVGRSLVRS